MEALRREKRGKAAVYFGSVAFLQDVATAVMGALTGRIAVFGGAMPFGAAYIAACAMCGRSTHLAIAAVAAVMLFMRPIPLAPLSMCALLYVLLLFVSRLKKRFDRFDRLLVLLTSQVALMPVFYRGSTVQLLRGVISLGLSIIAALVMQNALRALQETRKRHVLTDGEQMGISALFGMLLLAVVDVAGYGFSLSVTLLLAFSMLACYARGIAGVAAAVALACVLTVGGGFKLPFVGSVAACALIGAALRGFQRLGVIGGFVAGSLLLNTYVYTEPHAINLLNLVAAAAILILLPKEKLLALCGFLDANKERERYAQKSVTRMRSHVAANMRQSANVIAAMAQLTDPPAGPESDDDAEAQWMAQAAFGVCVDCPLKKICWRDHPLAAAVIRTLAHAYARGEGIRPTKPFDPACRNLIQMAAAACHAQNQYGVQQAMEKQQRSQHAFMRRQLGSVAEILTHLAVRTEKDRWLDEELEEILLAGLDRRGFRVYGADAFFPDGKLMLRLRVLRKHLYQLDPLTDAAQQVLRRPLRLLRAEPDGNYSTLVLEEAQSLCATMGAATAAKSGGVSGDCVGERRMERGRVLYALSDGMGTGEAARAESDAALALLFDLYETGFSRDVALESVNRLLLSKGKDMYATLDAVHLDLRTGEAEFMKYGAPPSFIYRGKTLHPVRAEALPAGILQEAIPAIAKTKLRRNDAIVLFSDGALDALGEGTGTVVGEALTKSESCQEAAKLLLCRARQLRREDDMTVMVIRIA